MKRLIALIALMPSCAPSRPPPTASVPAVAADPTGPEPAHEPTPPPSAESAPASSEWPRVSSAERISPSVVSSSCSDAMDRLFARSCETVADCKLPECNGEQVRVSTRCTERGPIVAGGRGRRSQVGKACSAVVP